MISSPCDQCPWRTANHGKRTPWGFYTKSNLTRLWNQIRSGINPQGCHPTDPGHPDHVAAGAKPGSTPRECAGSVILIMREMRRMADADGVLKDEGIKSYLKCRRKGITKSGVLYWVISRFHLGGVPFVGGRKLPDVNVDDPTVGLPAYLEEPAECPK